MSSIYRKAHCLHREKGLAIPRYFIFFDTETRQIENPDGSTRQELILGWASFYSRSYGRHLEKLEEYYFETAVDFWAFVYKHTEKKRKLWVISHNLVFDFTVVKGWRYLKQVGFKLKFFHSSGSTSIISVRGRYGSILFVDSMNWFAESLESIGRRLGLPKLKIDFDKADRETLSVYCRRDTEILYAAVKDFIKFLTGNHICRLCYTIGSTAMASYLFGHYDKKIYIHNNSEAIDAERSAYKGGRCECFRIGELNNGDYHILDVNSLYPFVMRNNKYPVKYKKILHAPSVSSFATYLESYSAVAKVLLKLTTLLMLFGGIVLFSQ